VLKTTLIRFMDIPFGCALLWERNGTGGLGLPDRSACVEEQRTGMKGSRSQNYRSILVRIHRFVSRQDARQIQFGCLHRYRFLRNQQEELAKSVPGCVADFVDVKDAVEHGDLEDAGHFLMHVDQLHLAAVLLHFSVGNEKSA
jgi:hypothetical protein